MLPEWLLVCYDVELFLGLATLVHSEFGLWLLPDLQFIDNLFLEIMEKIDNFDK